jgi:hypothetical protein
MTPDDVIWAVDILRHLMHDGDDDGSDGDDDGNDCNKHVAT